jgi:hypothetical protein
MATSRRPNPDEPPFHPWEGPGGLRQAVLQEHSQGEHVSVFGPSGSGKSTVCRSLMQGWREQGGACLIVANKNRTAELVRFIAANPETWSRIGSWPPEYGHRAKGGLVLWPPYPGATAKARDKVKDTFIKAFDSVLREGGWFVNFDEANYLVEQLGLKAYLDEVWEQARSSDISAVAGAQRPVFTTKGMATQQKWVMAFRTENDTDADGVGRAMGGRQRWGPLIQDLPYHEFIAGYLPNRKYYLSDAFTSAG